MVDDVNLEEEESQECEEERNKISAGYLSKKITEIAKNQIQGWSTR